MRPTRHLFQLLFIGGVTTVVAVWGSPAAAVAAAAICRVLAALVGATTASDRTSSDGT